MTEQTSALRETAIILYVFSGVHQGARIGLPPGTWVLGSDEECDLILVGIEPQHAQLRVEVDEGEPRVVLTPLAKDAQTSVQGQPISAETELAAGEGWLLGETLFAWNLPNVEQKMPKLSASVIDEERGAEAQDAQESPLSQPKQQKEEGEQAPSESQTEERPGEKSSGEDSPTEESTTEESKTEDAPLTLPPTKPKEAWWKKLLRPIPLCLLAILFCALSFPLTRRADPSIPEVKGILRELNIVGLSVTLFPPGILLEGSVPKWEDQKRIQDRVEELSYPVYLNIAIDDDLLQAVRNSLGLRGFFPIVRVERTQEGTNLIVRCFMRDTMVEADAFATLARDVTVPIKIQRHIVYAKDVTASVRGALESAGLSNVEIVFLPGQLNFQGDISSNRENILRQIRARQSVRFGVPLFGEITALDHVSPEGAKLALPPQTTRRTASTRKDAADIPKDLGGLKISGVFVAPLSFITTEDGQYLFQGSILPNGDTLLRITTKQLTLRRGDTVYTYHLRGTYE